MPVEGNGDLQNPVLWQNWMVVYLGYSADEDAVSRLTSYGSWHAYKKKNEQTKAEIKKLVTDMNRLVDVLPVNKQALFLAANHTTYTNQNKTWQEQSRLNSVFY